MSDDDETKFARWLDNFGTAWKSNDSEAIGRLVPPDGFDWHSSPFAEIFHDRDTLVKHWQSIGATHSEIEHSYEILCANRNGNGLCRYRATYLFHRTARVEADGIFLVRLDDQGRCIHFEEWLFMSRTPLAQYL